MKQNKLASRPLSFVKSKLSLMSAVTVMTGISFGLAAFVDGQVATSFSEAAAKSAQKQAVAKKEPTKFLRVVEDASGEPASMQTAITRYRPEKGDLVIDLIGAVHIGEGSYYKQLNDQFTHYDVVLYELVAPEGTRIPAGGKKAASDGPMNIVSWMQGQAQSTLGLASQLEQIDYQVANFTHADMSPTEMGEKMAERGDTPLTIGLSAISEMMRQQNKAMKSSDTNSAASQLTTESLFDILGDPLKMKRMMANQFADAGVMEMGMGASLNQLLVVDRNAAALKVLQKEIVKGNKKIAIFYGAAHMPDFEKHLRADFGLQKSKQVWIDAWDLTKAGNKQKRTSSDGTAKMLFQMLDELAK